MTQKVEKVSLIRWWDHWIAILVVASIVMVAWRLWITEWTSDLHLLVYLSLIAGATGLALGYSRFSPLVSALISTVYGIFTASWLFGTTVKIEVTWRERIINYIGWRLRNAITQFLAGETFSDPILFLSIMAILLWAIGSMVSFIIIRQGAVWPALIPLGITLLVIGHYDQDLARNSRYLITFLFFALLIVGRMTTLHYRQKWRQEGISTNNRVRADFAKTLVVLASAILMVSWIIPISPQQKSRTSEIWKKLSEPWDHLSEQISDIFTFESATTTTAAFSFFGDSMELGSGSPSGEEVVFTVTVEPDIPSSYRHYWRVQSYDYYENGNWSPSYEPVNIRLFPDNFNIQYPDWPKGQRATYTFTNRVSHLENLYSIGVPTWVSRPVEAKTSFISDSEEDLIALVADPKLTAGETYQVETRINIPTVSQLHKSSTEYPEWLDKYLQLPNDFSPEVKALAERISKGYDNPLSNTYDITRYLRVNIKYARTLPPLPPDVDPIEWFLFEERTGFCNYYATAQVLMLRSLGVPARIAVGFAEGEYDSQTNTYSIRRRNSHAWPEVYFVDYGWVAFEPTVSERTLLLPSSEQTLEEDNIMQWPENIEILDLPPEELNIPNDSRSETAPRIPSDGPVQPIVRDERTRNYWPFLFISLGALLTIAIFLRPNFFKLKIDPLPVLLERLLKKWTKHVPAWLHRWSYTAQMSAAEKAYRQLGRSIKILGQKLNLAETPIERAQLLIHLLPLAEFPALEIVHEYHLDQYSNHNISEERAKNAARQVRTLALQARLRQLITFWKLG